MTVYFSPFIPILESSSLSLAAYLELLLLYHYGNSDDEGETPLKQQKLQNGKSTGHGVHVSIVTPMNPLERGCQLSVKFSVPVKSVHEELEKRGIVVSRVIFKYAFQLTNGKRFSVSTIEGGCQARGKRKSLAS